MFGIAQRRLKTLREFEEAWTTPIEVPTFVRDLGEPGSMTPEANVQAAAHYVGGFLDRFDFRLFRNGGMPLLERRTPPLREEILIRQGAHSVRGAYVPMSFELHVSHEGLREIRERYWTGAGRPPIVLVSGNIGLTQQVPTFDIWNAANDSSLKELCFTLQQDVLPYLELLDSPNQLRRAIFDFEAPLFDHTAAIEWLLMEFGRKDARDYIRALVDLEDVAVNEFWMHHDMLRSETSIAVKAGETSRNLAVIAFSHDLFRRWLY